MYMQQTCILKGVIYIQNTNTTEGTLTLFLQKNVERDLYTVYDTLKQQNKCKKKKNMCNLSQTNKTTHTPQLKGVEIH